MAEPLPTMPVFDKLETLEDFKRAFEKLLRYIQELRTDIERKL